MVMNNIETKNFSELDNFVLSTRDLFRQNTSEPKKVFEKSIDLFISLSIILGDTKTPVQWKNSKEEDILRILVKIFECLLSIYYLYESGFFYSALTISRNIHELFLVAISIGFDKDLYAKWKYCHKDFKNLSMIKEQILASNYITDLWKEYAKHSFKEWVNCSDNYSHYLRQDQVENKITGSKMHIGIMQLSCEIEDIWLIPLGTIAANVLFLFDDIFNFEEIFSGSEVNKLNYYLDEIKSLSLMTTRMNKQ